MRIATSIAGLVIAGMLWCVLAAPARAADLTGAWADNTELCKKIFVKKGASISFAKDADLYGSGLVFEKSRIRGKLASCNIKTQKQDGDVLHMIATCSTDVALQTVQVSLKIENENRIVRLFPGLPELQMTYSRCAL